MNREDHTGQSNLPSSLALIPTISIPASNLETYVPARQTDPPFKSFLLKARPREPPPTRTRASDEPGSRDEGRARAAPLRAWSIEMTDHENASDLGRFLARFECFYPTSNQDKRQGYGRDPLRSMFRVGPDSTQGLVVGTF